MKNNLKEKAKKIFTNIRYYTLSIIFLITANINIMFNEEAEFSLTRSLISIPVAFILAFILKWISINESDK